MDLDIEVCKTIAIRHGLPLQFVIKEFHLMHILGQIAAFIASRPNALVFKGGTALSKVYLKKVQRFSEDLDFDLVVRGAEGELVRFSKELAEKLTEYKIMEFRRVRSTIQFYCIYETPLGGKDHVRIDIAPKKLLTVKPPENMQIESEFTHASVIGLKVYSIEDLTARKMNALAGRNEGKDVYDAHAALQLCSKKVLKSAIGLMLKSEGADDTVEVFMQKAIKRLEKSDPQKLRNLTNPFIPYANRPKNWEELKNDLLIKLAEL